MLLRLNYFSEERVLHGVFTQEGHIVGARLIVSVLKAVRVGPFRIQVEVKGYLLHLADERDYG